MVTKKSGLIVIAVLLALAPLAEGDFVIGTRYLDGTVFDPDTDILRLDENLYLSIYAEGGGISWGTADYYWNLICDPSLAAITGGVLGPDAYDGGIVDVTNGRGGWFEYDPVGDAYYGPGLYADEILYSPQYPADVTVSFWSNRGQLESPDNYLIDSVVIRQVPEPMTIALLGLGGLFLLRRRTYSKLKELGNVQMQNDCCNGYDVCGHDEHDGPSAEYWVHPDGNDSNPGTEQEPFQTIQHAIDECTSDNNDIIHIQNDPWEIDDYVTPPIDVNCSKVHFIFQKGVVVAAEPNKFHVDPNKTWKGDSLFTVQDRSNIIFDGNETTFRMRKSEYEQEEKPGSGRHVIELEGCSNVEISGLILRDSGGDGVLVQRGTVLDYCQNILIKDVNCDNNRREGIGVISVDGLTIENCVLKDTNGAMPMQGIGIEPAWSDEILKNIVIRNTAITDNARLGISVYLYKLRNTSEDVDIVFENVYVKGGVSKGILVSAIYDDGPADFNNIQAAIDDSNDGDTIIVADGTYTGDGNRDIDFLGKAITVRSESGPQNCIIDCEALGRGFYFGRGEDASSILDGFTITNARASVATIWCDESSPTITNCDISGNWATEVGGIYTNSSPRISNCTIAGNSGGQAGGIGCFGNPMIINCNIIGNVNRVGDGGGMQFYGNSSATVANCIIRDNSEKQIATGLGTHVSVSYSNVQGGWGGEGNIDADPCFAFGSDYHLMPDSPCIDAGTNNPHGGLPTHDPDGNARPLDGDGDTNSIADIGVYEFNAQEPSIALSANWMQFSTLEGAVDPEDQNLSIRNCSAGTLAWEVIENCSWLEVNPRNGESIGEIDDISVSIRISGLPAGRHDCELRIAANGATNSARMVVVTLYIRGNVLHVPSEYENIQSAIDDTIDGDTVLVADGTYRGDGNRDINFFGKAITLRSENGPENCIIDCNGTEAEPHRGFYFHNGEDSNSVLDGFTIRNGYDQVAGGGIRCSGSSPTIRNCIITNNRAKYDGGGISCNLGYGVTVDNCIITENSAQIGGGIDSSYSQGPNDIILTNCTFSANSAEWRGGAISIGEGSRPSMVNCILWGDTAMYGPEIAMDVTPWPTFLYISFSNVQGGEAAVYDNGYLYWEAGNIDTDPCFADPCNGDYHLKSQAGRWEPSGQTWVQDEVTSPCIDAGNPADPIGHELFPNGGIINMGAYGGTAKASKSYFGTTPCEIIVAGDINGDCKVNFLDFALMAFHWLEER